MRKVAREPSHTGDGGHTLRIDPAWDRKHDITLASSMGPTVLLKLMLHERFIPLQQKMFA